MILETVDNADDAVERANASRYGLTAGVLTGDAHRGLDIARRLQAGLVHVNDQPVNDEPNMPFGGVKESGWGRFGTGFGAEEFTELRWITLRGERNFVADVLNNRAPGVCFFVLPLPFQRRSIEHLVPCLCVRHGLLDINSDVLRTPEAIDARQPPGL